MRTAIITIDGRRIEVGYRDMHIDHVPGADYDTILRQYRQGFCSGTLSYYMSPGWWCAL